MDGPLLSANETEGGGVASDDADAADSPVLQVTEKLGVPEGGARARGIGN